MFPGFSSSSAAFASRRGSSSTCKVSNTRARQHPPCHAGLLQVRLGICQCSRTSSSELTRVRRRVHCYCQVSWPPLRTSRNVSHAARSLNQQHHVLAHSEGESAQNYATTIAILTAVVLDVGPNKTTTEMAGVRDSRGLLRYLSQPTRRHRITFPHGAHHRKGQVVARREHTAFIRRVDGPLRYTAALSQNAAAPKNH